MTAQTSCSGCRDGSGFDLPITMAFQPIIDASAGTVFAHEALVRGAAGEGAGFVLGQVSETNRYAFDQQCRVRAIEQAAALGLAADGANLSINFLPNAVYEPRACIRLTLAAAMRTGFPINRIIFEFTEVERLDTDHILNILRSYRAMGFQTAIDDFGAGYAGLTLLADFTPDLIKLDMALVRGVDASKARQAITRGMVRICAELGIQVIAEGVETPGERDFFLSEGVTLMQGYLFARPAFRALTRADAISWPDA